MGDAFGILKKLPSFKNLSLSELRNVQRAWNDEACLRDFGVIEKLILNWGPVGKLLGLFESSIFFYPAGDLHLVVESDSKKEDSDDGEDVTSENSVKEGLFVLEKLQPHTNLKELHIIDYDDAGYPSWMGHPSFDRLNHIQLQGCKVDQLPTLGQLPSLTRLYLHCIYGLKGIGEEFCRGGINEITSHIHHVPAFPSLNNLHFESMYDWEQWDDGVRQGDFPKLESLSIHHCPRLSQLSVLRNLGMNLKLSIHYCPAIHIPAEAIFPPNVKTLLYKSHNPMIYLSPGVELQNLQSLEGVFRARNHELFEILNSLPMNTDRLTIAALRNVRSSVMEVEANLKSQHRLDELTLKWSTDDITYADRQKSLCLVMKDDDDDVVVVDGRTDQTENASFILLEKLQPHINLWLLHITDYDGIRYPSWIGHPSFNRLTAIRLSSCKNDQLPTLGQLPSLCGLSLDSISGLKRIGHEFCRDTMMNNDKLAFPSLFSLSFEAMHDWQEWCGVLEHDFPRLEMFRIQNCRRLSRDMISLPQRLLKLTSRGWIES